MKRTALPSPYHKEGQALHGTAVAQKQLRSQDFFLYFPIWVKGPLPIPRQGFDCVSKSAWFAARSASFIFLLMRNVRFQH
ncbi:hypothetical protein AJ87_24265 [Rhizobium yanglingense]|nr:hypothetical protein AJ87_24265 [Rhizobium yanglingense]